MNEATVACFVAIVSVDWWIVICKGNTSSCEWDGGMSMVRSVRGKRGRYGVVRPDHLPQAYNRTKGRCMEDIFIAIALGSTNQEINQI